MPTQIQPKTEVARIILNRIRELGTNVRAVANQIGVKYETLRQVVKGDRPPANRLLRDLARELGLDRDGIKEKMLLDRLRTEAPGLLIRLAGTADAEVLSIARHWPTLTQEQRDHIRWLVESFVSKNTGTAAGSVDQSKGASKLPQ